MAIDWFVSMRYVPCTIFELHTTLHGTAISQQSLETPILELHECRGAGDDKVQLSWFPELVLRVSRHSFGQRARRQVLSSVARRCNHQNKEPCTIMPIVTGVRHS